MRSGLLYLLVLGLFQGTVSAARSSADSLLDLAQHARTDSDRVNYMNQAAWQYIQKGNYDPAKKWVNEALSLAQKTGYKLGEADSWEYKGVINWNLGNYPEALDQELTALGMYEQLNWRMGKGSCSINLGLVYYDMGNYGEALKYYSKAADIKRESKDLTGLAHCYSNIGNVYLNMGKFEEALLKHREALAIHEQKNNTEDIEISYTDIGTVLKDQGKKQEAMDDFNKALNIARAIDDRVGIEICLVNMADILLGEKKIADAKRALEESLKLSLELGDKESLGQGYKGMAEVSKLLGDHKNALNYIKLYALYSDSLRSEANTKKVVQSQMQYEYDKKTLADHTQREEVSKQRELEHHQEIARQRLYMYSGITGALLLLVVAVVMYNAFRQKKNASVLIRQQKILVEQKQKEILDSIYYARRIQRSLLPSEKYLGKILQKKRD